MIGLGLGAGLLLAAVGPVSAAAPQVYPSSGDVDREYFDCGTFMAHAIWHVEDTYTLFTDNAGTPIRDIEKVLFTGSFVNPLTGASIKDSGQIVWFDDLNPDGSFAATWRNVIRKSDYFKVAGREDLQTGVWRGVNQFDVNIPAACAALGA
jgi:hypothetical protein